MVQHPTLTREISPLPERDDTAHKGDVGRLCVIGGSAGDCMMIGAVALAANAAQRSGVGLVQMLVPEGIRAGVTVLAPCATCRTLPRDADALLSVVSEFGATVVAIGPGLGDSLPPETVAEVIARFPGGVVVDADALNQLSRVVAGGPSPQHTGVPYDAARVVLTPHPGEAARLLHAKGVDIAVATDPQSRRRMLLALHEHYGGTVVLKGSGTVITNGDRLYVNETGNSGMATGGMGDVLTGMIAGLIAQNMDPFEASILGTYLHGLAGDFAAGELGRWSMTAFDLIDFLPEAFCEYDATEEV